jgi:hypothetical protein
MLHRLSQQGSVMASLPGANIYGRIAFHRTLKEIHLK